MRARVVMRHVSHTYVSVSCTAPPAHVVNWLLLNVSYIHTEYFSLLLQQRWLNHVDTFSVWFFQSMSFLWGQFKKLSVKYWRIYLHINIWRYIKYISTHIYISTIWSCILIFHKYWEKHRIASILVNSTLCLSCCCCFSISISDLLSFQQKEQFPPFISWKSIGLVVSQKQN